MAELRKTFAKPKFTARLTATKNSPGALTARYLAATRLVAAPPIPPAIAADPEDDAVLACALAARADAIVSGDDHLLALRKYRGIPILTVTEALARLQASSSSY